MRIPLLIPALTKNLYDFKQSPKGCPQYWQTDFTINKLFPMPSLSLPGLLDYLPQRSDCIIVGHVLKVDPVDLK